MKAKDLAKFLLQHPEAEVVSDVYVGCHVVATVESAQLFSTGDTIPGTRITNTGAVKNDGECIVDVIYISN